MLHMRAPKGILRGLLLVALGVPACVSAMSTASPSLSVRASAEPSPPDVPAGRVILIGQIVTMDQLRRTRAE